MVAVAIYLVVQVLDRGGDVDTPAVTATTEQTTPTATATIEPSEAVIGPPTEVPPTPTPSPTPTLEPSPTLSPEPTGEPPIEPVETLPLATEDDPIIEPGS